MSGVTDTGRGVSSASDIWAKAAGRCSGDVGPGDIGGCGGCCCCRSGVRVPAAPGAVTHAVDVTFVAGGCKICFGGM